MRAPISILVSLGIFLAACTTEDSTPTRPVQAMKVEEATNTATPATPTATKLPSPEALSTAQAGSTEGPVSLVEAEVIYPEIESRCYGGIGENLNELDLSPTTRLLVESVYDEDGPWFFLGKDRQPEMIASIPPGAKFVTVSPDRRWVAYRETTKDSGDALWVNSMGGEAKFFLMDGLSYRDSFIWPGQRSIMRLFILGAPGVAPSLKQMIDPFTVASEAMPNVDLYSFIFDFGPNAKQLISLDRDLEQGFYYEKYDLQTESSTRIFSWLASNKGIDAFSAEIHWTEQGISFAWSEANGVSLALKIPPNKLDSLEIPLYRVMLDAKAIDGWARWWSSDHSLLLLTQRLGDRKFPVRKHYILDTNKWVVYDYCWNDAISPSSVKASLDNRHLAWTNYLPGSIPLGTFVLELETGKMVFLRDWRLLQWAEVD